MVLHRTHLQTDTLYYGEGNAGTNPNGIRRGAVFAHRVPTAHSTQHRVRVPERRHGSMHSVDPKRCDLVQADA
jgi:hypothetical protein